MPTVYRVLPDVSSHQYILEDASELDKRDFDGTPINRLNWRTPSTFYIANPRMPEPEFWGFSNLSIFAVPVDAAAKIVKFLDQSCQTLPIRVGRKHLLLCNVTYVVNALNKSRSRNERGLPHWITQYAFHAGRLDFSLFKIPQTALTEILCVEGLGDPEDDFKGTVERLGLTGLKFIKLWDSEEQASQPRRTRPKRRKETD